MGQAHVYLGKNILSRKKNSSAKAVGQNELLSPRNTCFRRLTNNVSFLLVGYRFVFILLSLLTCNSICL